MQLQRRLNQIKQASHSILQLTHPRLHANRWPLGVITLCGDPHDGSGHVSQLVEGKLVAQSQPVATSILEISSDEQMAALVPIVFGEFLSNEVHSAIPAVLDNASSNVRRFGVEGDAKVVDAIVEHDGGGTVLECGGTGDEVTSHPDMVEYTRYCQAPPHHDSEDARDWWLAPEQQDIYPNSTKRI
ncbi:hypothetical protein V502_02132 [Pseudogymnoascus sp. VKM F-4520 (FW-2644)]|nr:hypothetical protein V502_02132 [Pseudogymnoascus sp. VKM F-4520 (FW-2644)]